MDKLTILKEANKRLKIKDDDHVGLIIVYSLAKVGSTSLVSSLRISLNDKYRVMHVHNDKMLQFISGLKGIHIQDIIEYNRQLGKKVIVIDIYREEIERKLSFLFEALENIDGIEDKIKDNSYLKQVKIIYNEILLKHEEDLFNDKYGLVISDDDREKYKQQGSIKIEKNGIQYIKLRLRDNHSWVKMLNLYLDEDIYMIREYETKNKNIGKAYQIFKEQYKIPKNIYDKIIESESIINNTTREEREEYLKKWEMKIENAENGDNNDNEVNDNCSGDNHNKLKFELSQVKIKSDHYKDEGCYCLICRKKRKIVKENLRNNIDISDQLRINHEGMLTKFDILKEKINQMNKSIEEKRKKNKSSVLQNELHKTRNIMGLKKRSIIFT